jgi:hypothetical protein
LIATVAEQYPTFQSTAEPRAPFFENIYLWKKHGKTCIVVCVSVLVSPYLKEIHLLM